MSMYKHLLGTIHKNFKNVKMILCKPNYDV